MSTLTAVSTNEPSSAPESPYSRWRLTLGVLGRSWLWFLAGCLLVTLIPIAFGWRPFLVESGSMEPRISVGDVVLASPTDMTAQELLGRVIVFEDPDRPDRTKTHRAVAVDSSGQLVTKGDANPTNDSMHVSRDHVQGLGRLLVQYVGLPVIWAHNGQWLYLFLFVLTVLFAGWAVNRDREDDPEPDPPSDEDRQGGVVPPPAPSPPKADSPTAIAATKPFPLQRQAVHRLAWRLALFGGMCLALLAPTTVAAFAATTKNTGNSWAVPTFDYPTQILAISPKPYLYWKFDETTTGNTAADSSGNGRTGRYQSNGSATYFTRLPDGALQHSTPDRAITLADDASCVTTTSNTLINGQTPATVIIWFRTTTTNGGKLAGFEKPQTGVAVPSTGTYDRHLYMDGQGRVWFGVYNSAMITVSSQSTGLNDDKWHMAVGSVGPAGTKLYIDGVLQGTNSNTQGEATTGLWRAGCGNLAGWGDSWNGNNDPGTSTSVTANRVFRGSLDEFTVYEAQLTDNQISFLYFTH